MSARPPHARPFSAQMSEWLKERFYESRALQYPYASLMDIQARAARSRGQVYEAIARLLHLWKQMGEQRFGMARMNRLKELIQENCYRDGELLPATENRLRLEFIHSERARELRNIYRSFAPDHRVRLRFPHDEDPERQGDLVILKAYNRSTGERGVLLIKYSETILAMPAMFDLGTLASHYMLVLEPSSWGYQDARFLLYLGSDVDVLVQAPRAADFDFVEQLDTNLTSVRVGAGEWGDPSVFRPRAAGKDATCDVVMVAAWDPLKRHEVFFRAAANLKQERGLRLRIALIGYNMSWTRQQIEQLLHEYDLERQCTIYEDIPHSEVASVIANWQTPLSVC